ncbi:MAG: hypothetical protein KF891_12565 [Rhizobacter sp.]|nr:hypothetical protein [Rhizobacter sp.]
MTQAPIAAHTLDAQVVAATLEVRPHVGLGAQEALACLAHLGPNRLPQAPTRSPWRVLLAQFKCILILLGAVMLAALVGSTKDATVILADGRPLLAAGLEIDESALTGESQSVTKQSDLQVATEAPLGDRHNLAYMNTAAHARAKWSKAIRQRHAELVSGKVAPDLAKALAEQGQPAKARAEGGQMFSD